MGRQGRRRGGPPHEGEALLIVAAQQDGTDKIGGIRTNHVPDLTGATLHGFIRQNVEPGSVVRTVIRRFNIKEPTADDVCQEVLLHLLSYLE